METMDFAPATATMRGLIAQISDERLGDPTPCVDYTVGDLADHIGGLAVAFTGAARKEQMPGSEEGGTGDASRLQPGWREQIDRDLQELARAWADPAAYEGQTMAGPIEMSGPEAAAVALDEIVVHGWDLATALGVPYRVRDEDVEICLEFARAFSTPETAEFRGDAFGEVLAVPADAPPLAHLLGLLGRRM